MKNIQKVVAQGISMFAFEPKPTFTKEQIIVKDNPEKMVFVDAPFIVNLDKPNRGVFTTDQSGCDPYVMASLIAMKQCAPDKIILGSDGIQNGKIVDERIQYGIYLYQDLFNKKIKKEMLIVDADMYHKKSLNR